MKQERIFIDKNDERIYIDTYIANDGKPKPAMLVIPGGGYCGVSHFLEGEPIALEFLGLFGCVAQSYVGKELALHFENDLTPNANRELCDAIAQHCGVAITLSGTDETGYSLCIVSREQDAKTIGDGAAKALNGRGGGKKEVFQGQLAATRQEIEAYFLP